MENQHFSFLRQVGHVLKLLFWIAVVLLILGQLWKPAQVDAAREQTS
jgi:hypothetical protein